MSVCVRFSGLVFRFHFPESIPIPGPFAALACEYPGYSDEEIQICLLRKPLQPQGVPIQIPGYLIYEIPEGRLCIYSSLVAKDGCQVAFLFSPGGKHILYYPASMWDFYAHPLNCRHLIRGESLLIRHHAFLLHSSVVIYQGKAVLFCGPSGIGKSTQAELWNRYLGAEIINGDRCLIQWKDGIFWGGGSLWCGTSEIYRPDYAPIAGIFLLNQSQKNRIYPAGSGTFSQLFRQCTLNSWDTSFMEELTDLLVHLLAHVSIYHLDCQPDKEAVLLARDILFEKEVASCPPDNLRTSAQ